MELKYICFLERIQSPCAINRTNMELKFEAPAVKIMAHHAINRTNMELKLNISHDLLPTAERY